MTNRSRVAVIGVTGYAGTELARLLLRHPNVETPAFFLRNGNSAGQSLADLFSQFRGCGEVQCQKF